MENKKLHITILGAGESGTGCALLGKHLGHEVFLSDYSSIQEKYKAELDQAQIAFEEGGHDTERILASDLIIKSPGVPEKAPIVQAIRAKGITLWSEMEFASRYTQKKIIAITGTNGKTTTTSLTAHIFQKGGMRVALGGNIGYSFARLVISDQEWDVYVLEVSSFQLDDCHTFKPFISVITNITPDHLERYEYKLENYVASKFKIAQSQGPEDYLIYGAESELLVQNMPKSIRAQLVPYALDEDLVAGFENCAYQNENQEIIIQIKNQKDMFIKDLALEGKHNAANSMAAAMASRLAEIRKESTREALSSFEGIEHRLESVVSIGGIEFINDSKATNVNSTWYALESVKRPLVWIVGGVDKGNDYSQLFELVKDHVKAIVCLGKDNSKIIDEFTGLVDIIAETQSMEQAVKMSYSLAKKGDVVMLSPACASFDLFQNYEDRGNQFKYWVRQL